MKEVNKEPDHLSKYVDTNSAAEIAGVSTAKLCQLRKRGVLPSEKVKGSVSYRLREIYILKELTEAEKQKRVFTKLVSTLKEKLYAIHF